MYMTPIAISITSALSVVANSWRTQIRTHRTEVHKAGKGDNPNVLRVDKIETIELKEDLVLDA